MASRETRRQRGLRRGRSLALRCISELRDQRVVAGVSQRSMAGELSISQAHLWRIEASQVSDPGLIRLSEMASVLGLELAVSLHPIGDPLRDRGHQALAQRFDRILSPSWRVTNEALLPNPGDRRAWDKLLRLMHAAGRHIVGADLESRIRDVQALVRRTRARERDGGVDSILIVLSDSATNRRLVGELIHALGPDYATPRRLIVAALRDGRPLPGCGVILL